jgi:hypothetical protein
MKNKLIFAGILALVLVFGLITIGCPTNGGTEEENNVTKFEGTWLNGSDKKVFIQCLSVGILRNLSEFLEFWKFCFY